MTIPAVAPTSARASTSTPPTAAMGMLKMLQKRRLHQDWGAASRGWLQDQASLRQPWARPLNSLPQRLL